MIFRVLGPLEVSDPDGRIDLGAGKPAALLTTLPLQANAWVRAGRPIEAIWPERDAPPAAGRNLHTGCEPGARPGYAQNRPRAFGPVPDLAPSDFPDSTGRRPVLRAVVARSTVYTGAVIALRGAS